MMKKLSLYTVCAAILSAGLLLSGCDKDSAATKFTKSDGIRLQVKGETVLEYDPLRWQIGFNRDEKEFRIGTDNMSDYWVVRCDAVPQGEGESVTCDLTWTGSSEIKTKKGLSFKVEKTGSDGKVWLWNQDQKTGVVVVVADRAY